MEELDLPKFDPGPIHVNQFKKINKKGCGNIPKAFKKPVPTPKSAPNSNDSTPKNACKGPHYKTTSLKNLSTRKRSLKESGPELLNGKPAITMAHTLGKNIRKSGTPL